MANSRPKLQPATIATVALGGALGASARVMLPWPGFTDELPADVNPVATVIVNLLGAILLGFITGVSAHRSWPQPLLHGVTTGFLGSFTTMSTLAAGYILLILGQTISGPNALSQSLLTAGSITLTLALYVLTTMLLTFWALKLGHRIGKVTP